MACRTELVEMTFAGFHEKLGPAIEMSRQYPVALTKNEVPYAYVVSPDYFTHAEVAIKALHGADGAPL